MCPCSQSEVVVVAPALAVEFVDEDVDSHVASMMYVGEPLDPVAAARISASVARKSALYAY